MVRVLFVCLGNICRSPMADGIFQHLVNQAGLADQILVDSAGTAGYHAGERAHSGTRQILGENNIPYDGRSRQLVHSDFGNFEYILAMDKSNLRHIKAAQPANSDPVIRLFLDYADNPFTDEVPDPWYTGDFQTVYDLIYSGAEGLLATIRQEHNL